jgi:hypothetical protein
MIRVVICVMVFALAICGELFADPSPTPTTDKSQYTLFNPTPIDLRRPYNTDRPSKTDSPFTIDAGVFQVESDVWNWTLEKENHVRTRTWILSNTNFRLGLTNWMDLQVFPQFYVNTRTSGSGFGKPVTNDGFGDTTVRLKINLLGNDGGKLVIGFLSSLLPAMGVSHCSLKRGSIFSTNLAAATCVCSGRIQSDSRARLSEI